MSEDIKDVQNEETQIMTFLDENGNKVQFEAIARIYLEDKEIIDAINAVEAKLNGVGRVLIRPSGTEPLVRVMLEGENQEEINEMANSLVDLILSKV